MWKLSIEDDQGQSTIVQLVRGDYSVGRTEDNTIRLTERNISRHHARLVKQGEQWALDDLGSYNGCYVNGARVIGRQVVEVCDLIQLGDYRLELLADDAELAHTGAPPSQERSEALSTTLSLSCQTDRLVMVVGPTPGREYPLSQATQRIGRGEECELCVNHSSVSRWHADIHSIGSGRYEIVDHGSSNGIRINGVELARGLLDSRDLVELGDVVLKFIPAGQVYRPSPEESRQLAALLGVDVEGPKPSALQRLGLVWTSMPSPTRWGAVLLGLVVVVLFGVVVATRKPQQPLVAKADSAAAPLSPERRILGEATRQLELGNIEEAHRRALALAGSAGIGDDPAFKWIELKWAESTLARAEQSPSLEGRLRLLELVAQTTTVDTAVRRKAADQLAKLQDDGVDVAALPSGLPASEPPTTRPTPAAAAAAPPTGTPPNAANDADEAAPEPVIETPAVTEAASPPMTRTPPASAVADPTATATVTRAATNTLTQTAVASPKVATAPTSTTPSGAAGLATSSSLAQARATRDTLKRKVSAGKATERDKRLLRALCRQLGDTTCSR